ncbi:MAG: AraC family transcriptional regulator [Ruminococcaceae bacterium]|nr:AraC family transcriptional regulator [Oscillospiraceae bacterium]
MSEQYIKTAVHRGLHIHSLVTVHYFEYAKNYRFDGEAHPFWELVYVDKGELDATSGETVHHLSQGDILFHKPNEFHSLRANGVKAPNLVVIAFDSDSDAMRIFEDALFKAGEAERELFAGIIAEATDAFSSPLDDPATVKLERAEESVFAAEQMLVLLLEQLLIRLARRQEHTPTVRISSSIKLRLDHDLVDRIIAFMQENTCGNLTFSDVCRFSAQSATNLKTIFKNVTGVGVMSYYRTLKINEAKRMLREGDDNITQIADRLGYTSVHYFSRYFKRATGMTPSEYTLSIQAKI